MHSGAGPSAPRHAVVALLVNSVALATAASRTSPTVLSNLVLPRDTTGRELVTGEADVLAYNGSYYFYFNNWGDCPGVDCCDNKHGGCESCCMSHATDCTYFDNHTVVAYRSDDLKSFTPLGVVFSTGQFSALRGVSMFRPHTIYNPATRMFVMWYKATCLACVAPRPRGWYGVATSKSLAGPFRVAVEVVPGTSGGDQFLFRDAGPDGDGYAYLVIAGKIQRLNASYTGVVPGAEAQIPGPPQSSVSAGDVRWEAPVMFTGGVAGVG